MEYKKKYGMTDNIVYINIYSNCCSIINFIDSFGIHLYNDEIKFIVLKVIGKFMGSNFVGYCRKLVIIKKYLIILGYYIFQWNIMQLDMNSHESVRIVNA